MIKVNLNLMKEKQLFTRSHCYKDKKPIWCENCELYEDKRCRHPKKPRGQVFTFLEE